ncbi:hypothetical protein [Streptomyces sp. Amel2xC10]|uniref:hypothetical protein n=1 Tax=Streptomyces sp. Amel2xC10 TaxID=1305826 RepID=UPI000A088624|nr:hypothetical protein [Streptomyces sp. Amel2xC10]SMF45180.1 hypothetical protein SAMN02745830_03575 [Streptomyces sp. Amel2xC10]
MSTPPQPPQQPEQPPEAPAPPSAYPYPNPQSPAPGGPAGFPPAPQSGQPPLYAQPTLVGVPAQQVNPYAQPGPYPVVGTPPTGGSGGGAGRAVLWAALGAVVASAAWAAGVFVIGGTGDDPDLRGYKAPANLCTSADYSSFKDEYPEKDGTPTDNTLEDTALDQGYCSISLKKTGSSYADAYLSVQLDLHKKTDPGPEFTAQWKNYDDSHDGYDVDPVTGIGDEAYIVSEDTTNGTDSGSRYATLAVRDGWVTYTMGYSSYLSSYDDDKDPPELDEVIDWLKTDTRTTLEDLKD